MSTVPGVLMGPNLTSFIASNFALLRPTLVTIPGGTFMMGAGTGYGVHPATVSTFQMGRTTVTNEEYARYLDALGADRFVLLEANPAVKTLKVLALGPSEDAVKSTLTESTGSRIRVPSSEDLVSLVMDGIDNFADPFDVIRIRDHNPPPRFDGPRQPAIDINWFEAFVYAFLHGGMLPTEWQWEYAARVVQGREGLRDYATPSGRLTQKEAHYDAEATIDVDDPRYPTLENGLRHMTGNVWEWMLNWFGDYPRGEVVDPTGPLEGYYRSLRGGSWNDIEPFGLLASTRDSNDPEDGGDGLGFRVVAPAQR